MEKQELMPVVCVMNPDDIYWMKEHHEMSRYSDILLTPYEVREIEETRHVVFPKIRENVVFMLDPIEGKYIERTESTDADIVEKRINAIIVIVSLLGGKNFIVLSERKSIINSKKQIDVDVKVDVTQKVKVDSKTEVDLSKGLSGETRITATAEFEGVYSERNYYKAVALAQQYGLLEDPTINNFLLTRHPDNPNPCKRQIYEVNTCKDLKENLKVAEDLKVKIMNAVNVNVDVNVQTSHDERYLEVFKFEVEFGPVVKETSDEPSCADRIEKKKKSNKLLFWVMGGAIVALVIGLVLALI